MDVIHPNLVAGMRVAARDERDNPLGTLTIVYATSGRLTLGLGNARATIPPDAVLAYDREGLVVIAGRLSPELLAAIRAGQA